MVAINSVDLNTSATVCGKSPSHFDLLGHSTLNVSRTDPQMISWPYNDELLEIYPNRIWSVVIFLLF
jgi:hypothetical protein